MNFASRLTVYSPHACFKADAVIYLLTLDATLSLASALVRGLLVFWFGRQDTALEPKPQGKPTSSCCHKTSVAASTIFETTRAVFIFGYGELLRDFMLWFLVGIFFAALVTTLVPEEFLTHF